ncbi:hypothetical protein ACQP2T_28160 [Nonomuraea sp. CA-143628]|uniref:hypothetical protein n=1 Tax=Nonomuraea sp. CA-143628 TaxID=3239997 RepID=UPI003D8EA822
MIAATPGTTAHYNARYGDTERPVLAWSTSGAPLVFSTYKNKLVPANEYPGFERIGTSADPTPTHVVPGQGWRIEYVVDGEVITSSPVVAFTVDARGIATPLAQEEPGCTVWAVTGLDGEKVRLVPPHQGAAPQ